MGTTVPHGRNSSSHHYTMCKHLYISLLEAASEDGKNSASIKDNPKVITEKTNREKEERKEEI